MTCPRCSSKSVDSELGQGRGTAYKHRTFACGECGLEWETQWRAGKRELVVDRDDEDVYDVCFYMDRHRMNFGSQQRDDG